VADTVIVRALVCLVVLYPIVAFAQSGGTISGTVSLEATGEMMHGAHVLLSPLGRSIDSDENGHYEFRVVPAGSYELVADSPGLSAERVPVTLAAGASATVDLKLRLSTVKEAVTVTATGREETSATALQSVAVLDLTQLPTKSSTSLGEVLQDEPGIAKRSSGPGSSRPVIRGFDGDRVLIMQDGVSTGSLSSSSGDHGEPIDVNQLERIEVVRGPATLLYGSNAIGGVVNAVSRHDVHQHPSSGVRGFVTGTAGSNNGLAGSSAGFEFGAGNWQFWASGGGQRTGNYNTPIGEILNSQSRMEQTQGGLGYYGTKAFATFNYGFTDSRYGIPYNRDNPAAEIPELQMHRHNYRGTFGLRNIGFVDEMIAKVNFSNYNHQEIVENEVGTQFFNKLLTYRVEFNQKEYGRSTGTFGFSGIHRDYKAIGEESLTPPTLQDNFAVFTVQNLDFETGTRLQFGGRIEHNGYNPVGLAARSFTGFSGSSGVSQRLWKGGTFAVNYTHAFRAPALEELYNNGPHAGNGTFEIGNVNLHPERNDGIDVSLRHQSNRLRAEFNAFYYHLSNFVYFSPTGTFDQGLPVALYGQGTSRFRGLESKLDIALHPNLWLNLGADAVNARLTATNTPLPRIPPVRGHLGFEARYKGLSLKPEVVLAQSQTGVFINETPTAGYAVVNVQSSYTITRQHQLHIFSVNVFNAGDVLYRNNLSLLKAFAPEIGRGVRFTYSLQVF
jgi:iron complex outermembrane receptor protein